MRGSRGFLAPACLAECNALLLVLMAVACSCGGGHQVAQSWAASPNRSVRESRPGPTLPFDRPTPGGQVTNTPMRGPSAPPAVDSARPGCAHQGAVLYGVTYGKGGTSTMVAPEGDSVFTAAVATIARDRHPHCELIYQTLQGLLREGKIYWFDEATQPMLIGITHQTVFVGINRQAPNVAEAVRHEGAHAAGFLPEGDATYMAGYCWGWAT